MPLVGDMIKKLQSIDINRILDDSIREIEEFILDLNREQLYERGEIDVNVPSWREQYAESTKRQKVKGAKYKKIDFVTLRWEGDFYESFILIIFDDRIVIQAQDRKWGAFLENGNKLRFSNALGLTEESRDKLKKELLPVLIRRIKEQL